MISDGLFHEYWNLQVERTINILINQQQESREVSSCIPVVGRKRLIDLQTTAVVRMEQRESQHPALSKNTPTKDDFPKTQPV